ncbi:MAG: HAD-IA family hydrolase [Candidatus Rokubacteria bacterium]|nr:HAD-IA family hydrolase [Candidatus Rokubacteria bacterium]
MSRALVFDIGNTLVRTVDSIESAYLQVFARHGIPAEKIRLFKQFAGRPKHFLFAEALGEVPGKSERVQRCMAEFEAILVEQAKGFEEMPGASACLGGLGKRGWRIALASGFPRAVGEAIQRRFGWDYPMVCDEDVKEHRPAPDPVLKACAWLGVTPAETIVIGDTPQDIRSAHAAGAVSVAVATGKFTREELAGDRPGFILSALVELPGLLEREASLRQAGARG